MAPWLAVIGIGADGLAGLTAAARGLIEGAELLVGGERHLAQIPPGRAERLRWRSPLVDSMGEIAEHRGQRVVVLASGDPLWYGVGVTLLRHFASDEMIVLPHVSAFSLAAARMGWPLAECVMLTLHGRPIERLALFLAPDARLLILSEDGATPERVARFLAARDWGESAIVAFVELNGVNERRLEARAAAWPHARIGDLNTLAITCAAGPTARPYSRLAGLPDEAFRHDGQITKRTVRAATLAALAPLPRELLWDVGAGSGSIGIEWLRGGGGRAIAVERDAARGALIAENAAMLGVPELTVVTAEAPPALHGLPAPDAVFLGGGLATPGTLETAWQALKPGGRLVANAVTIDGEARLLDWQRAQGGRLCRIAVAEAEPLGTQRAWRGHLPVTQLLAQKTMA